MELSSSEKSMLRSARRAVLTALALTLVGAIFGLTIGRTRGALVGLELWLVAASGLFSLIMMVILAILPFDRVRWIAPLCSLVFLTYLIGGAVASITHADMVNSFLTYLFWFYPLLAFNRLVNVLPMQRWITLAIFLSALLLATGRMVLAPPATLEAPTLLIYCISMGAFFLMLGLFAGYREAYIRQVERAVALGEGHQALFVREQQLRRIFDHAASGIGWMHLDGRLQHANETFCRMLARSSASLSGVMMAEHVPVDARADWDAMLHDVRQRRRVDVAADLPLLDAAGQRMSTRISLAYVPGHAEDEAGAIVFVCLDQTAMRVLEGNLRQRQRMEELGRLTGGVAHDFNNLLTVIIGNTELLAERFAGNDAASADLAQMAFSAAERGAKLTRYLLAFARKQPLDPRAVNVNVQVADMQALLSRTLGGNIAIELRLAKDLDRAMVDPTQIDSALLNLCLNARDAMEGKGRLVIETANRMLDPSYCARHAELTPGSYVMVSVDDNGCGIDAAQLSKVFEPFFTTKDVGKGTGLGLSMVYGFIRQSGGHLEIESEPGQGTRVVLFLPVAVPASRSDSGLAALGPGSSLVRSSPILPDQSSGPS